MSRPQRQPRLLDGRPLSRTEKWCAGALVAAALAWVGWRIVSQHRHGDEMPGGFDYHAAALALCDELRLVLDEVPPVPDRLRSALARIEAESDKWKGRAYEHDVLRLQSALTAKLATVSGSR
jgi:hypothetical protein